MPLVSRYAALVFVMSSFPLIAQQAASKPESGSVPAPKPTTAAEAPNRDTSYIDEKGTAHVTRVVPVPQTVSSQAQLSIGRAEPDQGPPQPLEDRRKMTDAIHGARTGGLDEAVPERDCGGQDRRRAGAHCDSRGSAGEQ